MACVLCESHRLISREMEYKNVPVLRVYVETAATNGESTRESMIERRLSYSTRIYTICAVKRQYDLRVSVF